MQKHDSVSEKTTEPILPRSGNKGAFKKVSTQDEIKSVITQAKSMLSGYRVTGS